jgi:hypothetical protein
MTCTIRAKRANHTGKKVIHVSRSGCCSGFALARRVLYSPRKQLSYSPATHLRFDLHHHELRRWQASGLTRSKVQSKGRTPSGSAFVVSGKSQFY